MPHDLCRAGSIGLDVESSDSAGRSAQSIQSAGAQSDDVDLDQKVTEMRSDGGSRRVRVRDELLEGFVETGEVSRWILQVDGRLDHVREVRAARFEYGCEVAHRLFRLFFDGGADEFPRLRVVGRLTCRVQDPVGKDRLGVVPAGLGASSVLTCCLFMWFLSPECSLFSIAGGRVRCSQHLREKRAGPLLLRIPQNLGRRARLDDDTLVHEDDLIADLAGKPQLVGDHDHGHTGFRQGLHHVQYLTDEFRVER